MREIYKLVNDIIKIVYLQFIVIFLFSACNLFSFGSKQVTPASEAKLVSEPEPPPVIPPPTRAELVMKAIFEAYRDQIDKVEFQNDDWTILMKGKLYYYAGGRILPENYLDKADKYMPYQFYHYTEELPPWVERTPEEIERFKNWTKNRSQNKLQRSGFFLDELMSASTRAETENQLVRINFLGKTAKVHKIIQQKLVIIEERIKAAAKTDNVLQKWIDNLGSLEGYGWRYIADTHSRSYHAYGLAVDLLPKSLGGKQTYWLWTSQNREDWWNVSYKERYHPPEAVIKAFEANGFIWGGKWPLFDTMHFEYRPEVLYLNGMPPTYK
jgi:hypothetical protein